MNLNQIAPEASLPSTVCIPWINRLQRYCISWSLAILLFGGASAFGQNAMHSKYSTAVASGDAAPESGLSLSAFTNVVLEGETHLAFESFLSGSTGADNDQALLRMVPNSTPHEYAGSFTGYLRESASINGAQLSMNIANRQLSINRNGELAFNCNLAGSGGVNSDTGLYFYSFGGYGQASSSLLTEMAREGDLAPGGGGTLQHFGSGILDVQFRGINDLGKTFFQDIIPNSPGGFLDDWRFFEVAYDAVPIARGVEGQPAPNGGFFSAFSSYEMNRLGEVVLAGATSGGNVGNKIWSMDPSGGMIELVHSIPGGGTNTPVGNIRSLGAGFPIINDSGSVAFVGWTSSGGTGSVDTFIMLTDNTAAPVSVLLSEGTSAPDGNGAIDNISIVTSRYNNNGQFASGLSLRSTSGGTSDNTGIFRVHANGTLTQLLREGQAALSGNGSFGELSSATQFAFSDTGMLAILTNYIGTSGGAADNSAIVVTDGIDYFEVAREGQTTGGSTVSSLTFSNGVLGLDSTSDGINEYGQVAYVQRLFSNSQSIQVWTPDLYYRGGPVGSFSSSNDWTLSIPPYRVHDTFVTPNVNTVVSTGTSNVTVGNLEIGGNAGTVALQSSGSNNLIEVFGQLLLHQNAMVGPDISLQTEELYGDGYILSSNHTETVEVAEVMSPGLPNQTGRMEIQCGLNLSGTTHIELGGESLGEYDQVYGLDADLELGGSLSVSLMDGFQLTSAMSFVIFDLDSGSVVSTFDGLAEGALVGTFDGINLYITYVGGDGNDIELITTPVVGYVFHAGSSFESGGVQAALDTGKTLAYESETPQMLTFDNLINSSRGLNGLAFDVAGLGTSNVTSADFHFQVSPQGVFDPQLNLPVNWATAPSPISVTVISGAPDRIVIRWADNAIQNRWLRVTMLATANTGLNTDQTYYVGHLLGETDAQVSGGSFTVAFTDITQIRAALGQVVDASSIYDINKNGTIAFEDISAMRSSVGAQLTVVSVP